MGSVMRLVLEYVMRSFHEVSRSAQSSEILPTTQCTLDIIEKGQLELVVWDCKLG